MRILKILSILSITGIILLAFFSWYSCDDYCNRVQLSENSIFKIAWFQYMHWDGRSLSVAAFVQLFSLKYLPVELTTSIWAVSFVCVSVMVFKIIRIENSFFFSNGDAVIGIALICTTMWLGMWKLIPDIIYWATGGSYSLLNLLGMFWLNIFLSGLKTKQFKARSMIGMFFMSFICGLNSHNFVIALIFLCLIEFIHSSYILKDKRGGTYILFSFAGLVCGAAIVFLAPGNMVRLHQGSYHEMSVMFLFSFFLVLAKYVYWTIGLFILSFFMLWLSGKGIIFQKSKLKSSVKKFLNVFRKKETAFELIYRHKYFLAAVSTIAVFSVSPFFAVPRTAIFFGTFMIIYIFQHGWNPAWKKKSGRFVAGGLLFLSVFLAVIVFQLFEARSVKKQLAGRELIFLNSKGRDVIVPAVPLRSIPFAFSFTDISDDSSYWVNRCVAQHYGLRTIRSVTN